jgi:hypothetical protein
MNDLKQVLEMLYQLDKEDYKKSEVVVSGYGRLSLQTLEQSVAEKFQQLSDLTKEGGPDNIKKVKLMLDNGVLLSMVDAVNEAYRDLHAIKRAGGAKSKNIPKF